MEAVSVERGETESFVGPYRILSTLGRGGMGVVYRGEHPGTGERVAVKTVHAASASLVSGIRREIHALSRLRHPGVARIVGEGIHDGLPYYAMELYEGETLRGQLDRLWDRRREERSGVREIAATLSDGTASVSAFVSASPGARGAHGADRAPSPGPRRTMDELVGVLALIRGACAPLAYLHGEGVVHCDLKPANVVVREHGSPVLVDLGVASSAGAGGRDDLGAGAPAGGSVAYMAPEQLRGELVDARADLYALGVILYQALTGRRPFLGATIEALLYQQLAEPPAPPSRHTEDVPPALDELVLRLLATRPEDRLGHAEDVAEALGALGVPAPAYEEAPRPRAYLYRPVLAGRHEALGALDEALDRAKGERRGQRIFVGGESGVGKTRLALEIGGRAARRGITVIVGQCEALGVHGAAGSVAPPLHPLRPLLLAIADRCRERPERTPSLLGADGKILAPYAPALLDLPGQREAPDPPLLPPDASRLRLLGALRARVLAFAAEAPLLLVLDDVQWADELSLALLRKLDGDDFAGSGMVVLCLYRAEEARGELADLVRAAGAQAIGLGRLDAEGVARMVSGMLALREVPPALVSLVHERSEGNPFFVAEHLRAAIAEGAVVREDGRFRLRALGDAGALSARIHAPPSVAELLERRLSALDAPGRALVALAAVFGREVDTALLLAAAGMDEAAGMDAIEPLVSRQVLEASGGDRLRFTHDKLREAAYAGAPQEARTRLHLAAARAIEQRGALTSGVLAYHYRLGGAPREALHHARLAGRAALEAGAYREAVEHLGVALALADAPGGEVPALPRVERAALHRLHAQALYGVGRLSEMEDEIETALRTLGRALPRSNRAWGLTLAREILRQAWHRASPAARRPAPDVERPALEEAARCVDALEQQLILRNAMLATMASHVLTLNLAERGGAIDLVARTQGNIGYTLGMLGQGRASAVFLRAARESGRGTGDVIAALHLERAEAHLALVQARLGDALALLKANLARCEEAGLDHEAHQTLTLLAEVLRVQGRLHDARAVAERQRVSTTASGHAFHLCFAHAGLARISLALGRFEEGLSYGRRAEQYFGESRQTTMELDVAGNVAGLLLRAGDLGAAIEKADQVCSRVARQPGAALLNTLHQPLLDVYMAADADAVRRGAPRGEWERRMARCCRFSAGTARLNRTVRPVHLRQSAALAALRGSPERACRLLEESAADAASLGMPLEEGLSRLALARSRPGLAAARARAETLLRAAGAGWMVDAEG